MKLFLLKFVVKARVMSGVKNADLAVEEKLQGVAKKSNENKVLFVLVDPVVQCRRRRFFGVERRSAAG